MTRGGSVLLSTLNIREQCCRVFPSDRASLLAGERQASRVSTFTLMTEGKPARPAALVNPYRVSSLDGAADRRQVAHEWRSNRTFSHVAAGGCRSAGSARTQLLGRPGAWSNPTASVRRPAVPEPCDPLAGRVRNRGGAVCRESGADHPRARIRRRTLSGVVTPMEQCRGWGICATGAQDSQRRVRMVHAVPIRSPVPGGNA